MYQDLQEAANYYIKRFEESEDVKLAYQVCESDRYYTIFIEDDFYNKNKSMIYHTCRDGSFKYKLDKEISIQPYRFKTIWDEEVKF